METEWEWTERGELYVLITALGINIWLAVLSQMVFINLFLIWHLVIGDLEDAFV